MDFFSIQSHISEPRKKQYRLYFLSGSVLGMFASICLVFVFSFVQAQNATSTPSGLPTPTISVLSRETGGKGQYLTIEGSNFGSVPGTVTFTTRGEAVSADSSFQGGCEKLWWRNSYITIKVPQSVSLQQYKIKVKRPDGVISNEKSFVVTNASPTPGICGILPDNGPAGIAIKIYGDRFGREKGRVSIGGLINADVKDDQWTDTIITTAIPPGDLGNGRFRVVNASRTLSNQIPFTAGRCTLATCGLGSECCGDGSCRPQGMCERKVYACVYSWTFSTGNLGVDIGGSCVKNEDCASGQCGPDKKCVRGEKGTGESCKIDTQCQDGLKCEKGICQSILKKVGDTCTAHGECLSGKCLSGKCQKGDKTLGDACGRGDECSSGNCYKGKCGQSLSCLKVLSIKPTGTAAARNTPFVITFNQLIDDASAQGKVSIFPAIAGSLTVRTSGSGNTARSEAVFSPSALLTTGTKYSVKLSDSIKAFSSDNTLGRCVTPGEGEGGMCHAPNSKCSVSGACLPQCSQNDPPSCAAHEKVCKDKTTGGLYCRTECKPGDSVSCSSSTSCSATDSCKDCAVCKDQLRCKQQACAAPNSSCSSGKCLPQCPANDPPVCRADQKTCQDKTTKNFFCATTCPGGSDEACLAPKTACSSGKCLPQCPIGDPPQCKSNQVVCKDNTSGASFCSASPCPSGSTKDTKTPQVCGNNSKEGTEECDDGDTNNANACRNDCTGQPNLCGNGIKEGSEQCDDGDTNNANSCRNNCTGQPNVCGNGSKEGTEECDDGDTNNANSCRNDCSFQKTLTDVKILINGKEPGGNTVDTFDCIKNQSCPTGSTPTHTYTIVTTGVTPEGKPTTVPPASVVWTVTGPNTEITKGTPISPTIDLTAVTEGTGTLTVTVKDDAGNQKQGSITVTSALTPSSDIISYTGLKVTVDGREEGEDTFSCLKGKPCVGSQPIHSYTVKTFGENAQGQESEITPVSIQWATSGVLKAEGDVKTVKTATIKTFVETYGSGSASVTITARKKGADGKIELVSATSTIQVTACANMWSYAHADYDFSTSYCADEGGQKLPLLKSAPTPPGGITRYNDPYEREYIFQFDPDTISASSTPAYQEKLKTDVIVIRIAKNAKGVGGSTALSYAPSLHLWYTEKIGSILPGAGTVDGFRALKEPIGTYINMFVPSKNDFYVLYITANANASPETLQVYNQLVSRIFLATSPTSAGERDEIKHDTQRLDDLGQIAKRLDEYKNASGAYPKLLAGSYLSGQTTSLWPSWQQNFGAELKATLPTDPVPEKCITPYNENTCWDAVDKRFYTDAVESVGGEDVLRVLQKNSSLTIYAYKTPHTGSSYELCTNLESSSVRQNRTVVNTAAYCISK